MTPPGSMLGHALPRVLEDPDVLLGRATYVDDLALPGVVHLALVRSPMAQAEIVSIEADDARKMPGVAGVWTAADLDVPTGTAMVVNPDFARPPLARGRVRFVGDVVAVVAAETKAAAVDAAELVVVDYEPLPAVVDPEAATDPAAPLQFPELGTNVAAGSRDGDEDPLAGAEVVVRGRFENQRLAVMPLEGNAIAVRPRSADGPDDFDLTVWVGTQMPHGWRDQAAGMFGVEPARLRVIAPHVGGAFGGKVGVAAEHAVAVAVARRLGRPVKWVETRSENLVAMPHGRGQVQYVELGLRRDGAIVGLRCRIIGDGGAYAGFGGGLAGWTTKLMAQGPYRIPRIAYDVASVVTNTTPMGAFRGAGRPEATAFLERLLDMAADELDLDPVEIRRRNFLSPDQFPCTTVMGASYDSGDYGAALTEALRLAGYDGLRAEQAARRARGDRVLLGIGLAAYVEITAGGSSAEWGSVDVHRDGTVTVRCGTSAHGQGHATAFAMLVADRLGVPVEAVRFVQSDTALVPTGGGTGGSRSLQIGGSAVLGAAEAVLAAGKELAARLLEAAEGDIVVTEDGRLAVAGVPARALTWAELAAAGEEQGAPLAAEHSFTQPGPTFPFGVHVAVVEVDTETGLVRPRRHIAVDDCGRVLNPLLVEGQQHGGVAQGISQALWEAVAFDDDGNPLTATLADYCLPSAAEFPSFETAGTQTPTPMNPLGFKGIGESGTVGSMPAVQNAVIDALSHLGVRHLDPPLTPERVWRAITAAASGVLPAPWREPPAVFEGLPRVEKSAGAAGAAADL
ncbi:MAG TPA: xanthine dehydrogenase family protein molybdopterin-binding subunit [Acidimicrobiia bacterium]|nr:xanthine dehydrogenase family protein molybdopterin-binding subunit [Acidimicrobiia bacterium]